MITLWPPWAHTHCAPCVMAGFKPDELVEVTGQVK
jgi:hypothetical protein